MSAVATRGRTQDRPRDVAVHAAARAGLVARGVLYALLGTLTIQVVRIGHARADEQGARSTVVKQPFGSALLIALAAGLAAYAAWRVVAAVKADDEDASGW